MCVLLAELLKESSRKLGPELIITLRAKLWAKLEMGRIEVESTNAEVYKCLFSRICPMIKTVIEEATAQVEAEWTSFRWVTTRRILKLPLRIPNHALQLSLVNSSGYLDGLLINQSLRHTVSLSFDLP